MEDLVFQALLQVTGKSSLLFIDFAMKFRGVKFTVQGC